MQISDFPCPTIYQIVNQLPLISNSTARNDNALDLPRLHSYASICRLDSALGCYSDLCLIFILQAIFLDFSIYFPWFVIYILIIEKFIKLESFQTILLNWTNMFWKLLDPLILALFETFYFPYGFLRVNSYCTKVFRVMNTMIDTTSRES